MLALKSVCSAIRSIYNSFMHTGMGESFDIALETKKFSAFWRTRSGLNDSAKIFIIILLGKMIVFLCWNIDCDILLRELGKWERMKT